MSASSSPLFMRPVADYLYSYALSSAYKADHVYDPSLALSREPEIFELVRRDAVIASAMDRRNRSLVRSWTVEPARNSRLEPDRRAAGICEDAIGRIQRFNVARRRLCDAHYLGRVYMYLEGDYQFVSLDGNPDMVWWIPTRLVDIDRRRFRIVADWHNEPGGSKYKTVHLELFSTDRNKWEPIHKDYRKALIEYTYGEAEDRVGYGRGLLESTYFYHYLKGVTFEKVAQGIDRWANGIVIAKLDSLRNSSVDNINATLKQGALNMLRNMRSEHVAVAGKEDEIEVVETSGAGHEISMNFMRYLDEGIERLYNGSLRPSGHGSEGTGARAEAETQADTSEAFYQDDREDLDECINSSVLEYFWSHPLNRVNFVKMQMGMAKRPRFTTKQEKKEDPKMAVEVMNAVLDRGVPVKREEYYERAGLSIPSPNEDVIQGREAPTPGLGFDGFMGDPSAAPPVAPAPVEAEKNPEIESKFSKIESTLEHLVELEKDKARFQYFERASEKKPKPEGAEEKILRIMTSKLGEVFRE